MPSRHTVRFSLLAVELELNLSRASVMMIYDIFLTLPTEVEKIWKQRLTGLTLLWVMVCDFAYRAQAALRFVTRIVGFS